MEENIVKNSKKNKMNNLIGILLMTPIYIMLYGYIIIYISFEHTISDELAILLLILLTVLICTPVIIGNLLAYRLYKNKIDKSTIICVSLVLLFFLFVSTYCFCEFIFDITYGWVELGDTDGWEALGKWFGWLIFAIIYKVFAVIFYFKLVGIKKGLIFFFSHTVIFIFPFLVLAMLNNVFLDTN